MSDSKKYQGTLLGVEGDDILLELPKDKAVIKLDFANIKEAKLVLTEELFRKIIK